MIKNTFNILSIDGGGIKGLYASRIIEQIEKKFGVKAVDHFDLICGTSTGGLIALALSLGHSAAEISDFYTTKGKVIFPITSSLGRGLAKIKQGILGNKYDSSILRQELELFFGTDKKIKDCRSLLCIPAYNITDGQPIVFKYSHSEGDLGRDNELNIIDVALATSAAPTYFKNHKINAPSLKNTMCTDGGVWCNNPSLSGLIEAWDYFVGKNKQFDNINILSVSTIPKPSGENFRGGSLGKWKDKLIGTALEGQSYFADYFLKTLAKNDDFNLDYRRIRPNNLTNAQYRKIDMDLAKKGSIDLLNRLGTRDGLEFLSQNADWISKIVTETKKYLIK